MMCSASEGVIKPEFVNGPEKWRKRASREGSADDAKEMI